MKKLTSSLLFSILCTGTLTAQGFHPAPLRTAQPATTTTDILSPQPYRLAFHTFPSDRLPAEAPDGAVIWEDFAKFTEGSENSPSATDMGGTDGRISPEKTQMAGWTGFGVYQAGGMAYLGFYEGNFGPDTGFLNTPIMDVSGNNGAFTLNFRAKSKSTDGDQLSIQHFISSEQFALSSASVTLSGEWAEYSVPLDKGTNESFVQIYAGKNGWLIDDISVVSKGIPAPENVRLTSYKATEATAAWDAVAENASYLYRLVYLDIETNVNITVSEGTLKNETSVTLTDLDPDKLYGFQVAAQTEGYTSPYSKFIIIEPLVAAPTPIGATDYDGTSFTAHWNPLEGAASYTLYVVHTETNGWNVETIVDLKQETTATTHTVTGLDPETIYSFAVQAKMSDGEVTAISDMMKVLPSVPTPTATEATEVTADSFTANWTEAKGATHYQVNVYKEHTATADVSYAVADGQFDFIQSSGTLDAPETLWTSYITPVESGAFDWHISMGALMNGAIGLDNSMAAFTGSAFMYSPMYDLTPFTGKVSFDITLASADATAAVIALAYADEENNLHEIETFEVPVTPTMTNQRIEFTKSGEKVCIVVYAKNGNFLMFENFRLTVGMTTGSKIEMPYNRRITEGGLSQKFENVTAGEGDRISYDVLAAMLLNGEQLISDLSNRVWVELESSSVDGLKAQEAPVVYMSGNVLNVENPTGAAVEVYNMAGQKVFSDNSGEAVVSTQLDMRGAYIVKVGNTAVKVMR